MYNITKIGYPIIDVEDTGGVTTYTYSYVDLVTEANKVDLIRSKCHDLLLKELDNGLPEDVYGKYTKVDTIINILNNIQ